MRIKSKGTPVIMIKPKDIETDLGGEFVQILPSVDWVEYPLDIKKRHVAMQLRALADTGLIETEIEIPNITSEEIADIRLEAENA